MVLLLRWLFLGSTDHFHWRKLLEMICSFFGFVWLFGEQDKLLAAS